MKEDQIEKILWSIAFPGFPQLLEGKIVKGILFVGLEILINVNSNFNTIIMLSFQGHIQEAINQTNYEWLIFYPCLYFFAMWDAYRNAQGKNRVFAFTPFVFSAYFVTVGVMYSPTFTIRHVLLGPVWLPILCLPIGLLVGMTVNKLLLKITLPKK